ncbi:MAG: NmrA family NAD(P)-binding protein [Rhodoferax sp.]|nr:NmrA family NAD(P)-binding protein [Rhodoferax sp.]
MPVETRADARKNHAMPARVLIVGASGQVGRLLLDELQSDASLQVVAASRSPQARQVFARRGMQAVHLDHADRASVRAALAGIERVFLCTGYSVDMLVHSKQLLDLARDAGVRQVVHLGALGPVDSVLPHFVWHGFVEAYIERLGFQYTHLRPRAFMQNVLASVRPATRTIVHFSGQARIGWIDAGDIARVAAAALRDPQRHAGMAYPLVEDVCTMDAVAAVAGAQCGVVFTAQARDPGQLLPALLKSGMEPTYAASLASGTVALASDAAAAIDTVHPTVLQVTGKPGVRWPDFASRHVDRLMGAN